MFKAIFKRLESSSSLLCETNTINSQSTKKPHFAPYDAMEASVYRHRRQVGVNLGSIFILDKQLAPPSLRSCVINDSWESELDFLEACMTLERAKEAMEDHWSTFVTEKDFEYLSSIGINSVRIPIGYWIIDSSFGPFKRYGYVYQSAWYWFLNMIAIAAKYKIGVLVDLHGAPGNQNTLSQCGTSSHKAHFFKSSNQEMTLNILKKLAVELAPINNVIGLSLLNEPIDDATSLIPFYTNVYRTIRRSTVDIVFPIYINDSYETKKYIDMIKKYNMKSVIIDTHFPFNTTEKKQFTRRRRSSLAIASLTALSSNSSSKSNLSLPSSSNVIIEHDNTIIEESLTQNYSLAEGNIIIGEWSSAAVQEASSIVEHSELQQLDMYDRVSSGHYFWNYRTSDDNDRSSFVYCHRAIKILPNQFITGTIPMSTVLEISALAKSRFRAEEERNQNDNGGYSEGYKIALMYLELYQSRIGFKQQLAHNYSMNHNEDYEQGFLRALFTIDQIICEYLSNI